MTKKQIAKTIALLSVSCALLSPSTANAKKKEKKEEMEYAIKSSTISALKFRNIGPAWASGRIADFAINPNNHAEYFVAVASGNVWKTNNNGATWKPVFDNYGSYSTSDVEWDQNNPNIVWVGTGENNHQRALGYGDGIYKSVDGGKSFKNMGLKESRQIGKIIIHPDNSNIVFVAAEGSAWGPGKDRGLYKTTDGGENWEAVLQISENTGVNNVVFDPSNPEIMYATSEQRRRTSYTKIGGGPESAVYKSTDGGASWNKIMKGLPSVHIGGMGLAVSPVAPHPIYIIMEAADKKGGFFRSTNQGASWEKMSSHSSSGQYYNEIECDPIDPNKVFSVETYTQYTTDGGKTWSRLSNNKRHVDDHAIWIDPSNTNHLLVGGDGGIYESFDHGKNWDFKENLPITQFYRVSVDNAKPFYNIYGGTQDNNSMGGPSQNISRGGVTNDDWIVTMGGDGFWSAVDPTDPNTVYTEYQYGNMFRYDKQSGETVSIKPRERKDELTYKWNWNTPLFISPASHKRLYCAANKVFRSDDYGNSWQVISDDLTAQVDRNSFKVMDKYWPENAVAKDVSTSQWGTIISLNESRIQEGLIVAGTDDGVISITEDNGQNWSQTKSFSGVPQYTMVSDIQTSKFDENIIYATFDNLKRDDFTPYVFRSNDKGKTWKSISNNLPKNGSAHVIQQDFKNPDLLFVGTEFGVYFTVDAGAHWVQMKSGMPTIAIFDIAIQEEESDLVLASFGRGFFVLDDYSPLRELTPKALEKEAHLFPIAEAISYNKKGSRGNQGSTYFFAKNPEYGATFTYYLKEVPETDLQIRRKKEKELFKNGEAIPQPTWHEVEMESKQEKSHLIFTIYDETGEKVRRFTKAPTKGINRVNWDLCYQENSAATVTSFDPLRKMKGGLPCFPGEYKVEISLWNNGEEKQLVEPTAFSVRKLDNITMPATDLTEVKEIYAQLKKIGNVVGGASSLSERLSNQIASIAQTVYQLPSPSKEMMEKTRDLAQQIEEIRFEMNGVKAKASGEETPPSVVPLRSRYYQSAWARSSSSGPVTQSEQRALSILNEKMPVVVEKLRVIAEEEVPSLLKQLDALGAPWTPGRIPTWE